LTDIDYDGFYINLARDGVRKRTLQRQLAIAELAGRYRRFEAVDGAELEGLESLPQQAGDLGCYLSHESLLAACRGRGKHVHVLEDDASLPPDARRLFATALLAAEEDLEGGWDLLYTDVLLTPDLPRFLHFRQAFRQFHAEGVLRLVPLADTNFTCTSSYFVHRDSIDRVHAELAGRWREGKYIDLHLRELVHSGVLRAYTTMPFVTSVGESSERSSIRGELDSSRRVHQLYRRSLYKDADHEALLGEMRALTRGASIDAHDCLLVEALGFRLSDRWEGF